ncbi:MAG: ATPase domain-containing protein [Chloroflexota bacterium]
MIPRPGVTINRLVTGVPGLDEVLGGGLPEYSFNLIAGAPGTGKTTLAQQIMYHLATPDRPVLHFTVLGEPSFKMLRYQQQFSFFDHEKVGKSVHYTNLSDVALEQDLGAVLDRIVHDVQQLNPGVVVVDSFRSVLGAAGAQRAPGMEVNGLLQRLSVQLTTWQATTFLIGEYLESEMRDNPVFTVADGILWLYQSIDRNSSVRKLQALKMRGQATLPGLHTMRITSDGIQVFPRIIKRLAEPTAPRSTERLSVGVPEVDGMLGGGIRIYDSVLVAGPAGSGKSALATQFITEGLKRGEPGVIAVFEERPKEYVARANEFGLDLATKIDEGLLQVIYLRPLDLSVDEALLAIQEAINRIGAQRLVIDSLSGFELALAPTFREEFRESLYRMVGALTGSGVTVFMTAEVAQSFVDLQFSPSLVSFLTDDIILQRYVELNGQLRKVMAVVKMRGSQHSKELRLYEVTEHGLEVGEPLTDYVGIITGVAQRRAVDPDGTKAP